MFAIKETIESILKGIPNSHHILNSLVTQVKGKYGYLSEPEQEEIVRRKLICHSCPLYSLNVRKDDTEYKRLFNKPFETEKKESSKFCSVCGCQEEMKVSSLSSSCGLSSYNEEFPNNKQPLKWAAFKK